MTPKPSIQLARVRVNEPLSLDQMMPAVFMVAGGLAIGVISFFCEASAKCCGGRDKKRNASEKELNQEETKVKVAYVQ